VKYPDGTEARLGDKLRYSDGSIGIIVCSIDTDEYSASYPKDQWSYLKKGIMVESKKMGLVYHEEPDNDMVLIESAK
jgi:hypothetical protein